MTDPGLLKYTTPVAQGTGDLMFAQAKRDQDEYDRMMQEESEADAASDAQRAFAIRRAMEAQGATEEEILDAIAAAGYKAGGLISLRKGGRVGFDNGGDVSFGGITEAVEKIEKEPKEFLVDKLKNNIGLSAEKAVEDAEAMILRKRPVKEGFYAMLNIDDDEEAFTFYRRTNNKWERDDTMKSIYVENSQAFCNIQKDCLEAVSYTHLTLPTIYSV